jgi:hypothetical protein
MIKLDILLTKPFYSVSFDKDAITTLESLDSVKAVEKDGTVRTQ